MSINYNFKCDSVDTKFSEPSFNFPCKYYIDRNNFIKKNHGFFETTKN